MDHIHIKCDYYIVSTRMLNKHAAPSDDKIYHTKA